MYEKVCGTDAFSILQSVLRKKLVNELQASGEINLSSEGGVNSSESSLFVQAANSIIADHLKQFGYEYSRAVFIPESGLSVRKVQQSFFGVLVFHFGVELVRMKRRRMCFH